MITCKESSVSRDVSRWPCLERCGHVQLPVGVGRVSQKAQWCFLHEGLGMSCSQETSTEQPPWARWPLLLGHMSGPGPRWAAWPAFYDRPSVSVSWVTGNGCTVRGLHLWARVPPGASGEGPASVVWGQGEASALGAGRNSLLGHRAARDPRTLAATLWNMMGPQLTMSCE